jgi:hypothetical protein
MLSVNRGGDASIGDTLTVCLWASESVTESGRYTQAKERNALPNVLIIKTSQWIAPAILLAAYGRVCV